MNASGTLGDNTWVMAVSLILWTGVFLYLFILNRKLRHLEKDYLELRGGDPEDIS